MLFKQEMQQVIGEQKVPKPDWYVQKDTSSEEVQVSSGLETYRQEFDTINGQGGGGQNVQTNEIK